MKGNQILVSAPIEGRMQEGILDTTGTPKPGTVVQKKAGTAPDGNGHFIWTEFNRDADGNRPAGALGVLLEKGEGYSYADAYADGDHCFVYLPLPGDQLNMLWSAAGTGASDAIDELDLGIVDDGTGLLVATTGSPEIEPFAALEAVADVVATGTLVWSEFTGY